MHLPVYRLGLVYVLEEGMTNLMDASSIAVLFNITYFFILLCPWGIAMGMKHNVVDRMGPGV